MLSFSDFVQSRKAAGGAAEQVSRSRSAGHGASHPLLQQLDALKLQRSATLSSRLQPHAGVAASAPYAANTEHTIAADPFCATAEQPVTNIAALGHNSNAFGVAATEAMQHWQSSSACSSRLQQLQGQLVSSRLTPQHTTTTVSSVASSTVPSGTVSRTHSLRQLLVAPQAAAAPVTAQRAPRAAGSASQIHNMELGSSSIQPLSMTDALPSPKSSRSLANIPVSFHAAAVRGSYTSPPTPLGRPYAGRACNLPCYMAATGAVSPGIAAQVQQSPQAARKQASSLSVHSRNSHPAVGQHEQLHLQQQGQPAEVEAAYSQKSAALWLLQQQQQQLQQALKLHSFKRLQQHQPNTATVQSESRSKQEAGCIADNDHCGTPAAGMPAAGQLVGQPAAQQQHAAGGPAIAVPSTGKQAAQHEQQQSDPVAYGCRPATGNSADTAVCSLTANTPQVMHMMQYQQQANVAAASGPDSSQHMQQQAQPLAAEDNIEVSLDGNLTQASCSQQQQPTAHMPTAAAPDTATAQEVGQIPSDPSTSSSGAALLSPETTDSSQDFFSTPAGKPTQRQAVPGVVCIESEPADQPSFTASDPSAVLAGDEGYSRMSKHRSEKDSSSYLQTLRSSRLSKLRRSRPVPAAYPDEQPGQDQPLEDVASRSDSHVLLVARRHAQQLQQQNDALVQVLERERQQNKNVKQQVSDAQLELKECHAEWEVALQVLRQDKAALTAQLRKAMAGTDQQEEVLDAYDSALATSALKVEEAQQAAAALAAQLTDTELQLNQLQHMYNKNTMHGVACLSDENDDDMKASSSDAAAVALAVAAAERRSGAGGKLLGALKAVAGAETDCTRGLRALRQHQKHLEQQIMKQQQELSKLQRDNIKLTRFKKQYVMAANKLQAATAAQAAAVAAAEEAGLRAAAANGKADRLQQQVEQLSQETLQLKVAEQELKQQMHELEERLQQAQQELSITKATEQVSPSRRGLAGVQLPAHPQVAEAAAKGSSVRSLLQEEKLQGKGCNSPPVGRSQSMLTRTHAFRQCELGGEAANTRDLKQSVSAPSRIGTTHGNEAMTLVQQVAKALPVECPVQQQLSSLMSAIADGIEERKALAAQGQMLLGMVMGTS